LAVGLSAPIFTLRAKIPLNPLRECELRSHRNGNASAAAAA
jgi:hypothetical protein